MFRSVIISIIIITCIAFSPVAWAQESQDEKLVKGVIEKELKGALTGNPEQMKSCYAPDFVGFRARNDDNSLHKVHMDGVIGYADPEDWKVGITTPKELEVVSVNVKDNFAIAVTRHWGSWLEKTTNENVQFEGRSVWLLKKTQGEWKIFSNIYGVSAGFVVTKALPQ